MIANRRVRERRSFFEVTLIDKFFENDMNDTILSFSERYYTREKTPLLQKCANIGLTFSV